MMNSTPNTSVPPHVEALYYNLIGSRNLLSADFRLMISTPIVDDSTFSKKLYDVLDSIAQHQVRIETLVKMYPKVDPNYLPPNESITKIKDKDSDEKKSHEDINKMEKTPIYEDGGLFSKF